MSSDVGFSSLATVYLNYIKNWNYMTPQWYSDDGPGAGTYYSGQLLGLDASLFPFPFNGMHCNKITGIDNLG